MYNLTVNKCELISVSMRSQAAYGNASLQTQVGGVKNIFPPDEEPSGSMHKLSVEWKQIVIALNI